MPIVEVNGQNVQFPDNMTNDDITAAIKKIDAPAPVGQSALSQALGPEMDAADTWMNGVKQSASDVGASAQKFMDKPSWGAAGETALRAVGGLGSALYGIPMAGAQALAGGVRSVLPEGANAAIDKADTSLGNIAGNIPFNGVPIKNVMKNMDPEDLKNYAATMNALPLVGEAAPALGVAGDVVSGLGNATTGLGKTILGGDMKIPKSVAKGAYGDGLAEQKQGIIDDLVKFKLDSPTGNYAKMADKAQGMASKTSDKVDGLVEKASADPNVQLNDPLKIVSSSISNLNDLPAAAGHSPQAQAIVSAIKQDFIDRGYTGDLTPDKLVAAKQFLNADGKVFDNGPMASDADNLDRAIRKKAYLSLVDQISETVPGTRELNQDVKRLIDISDAATAAASRTKNNYVSGLMGTGLAALPSVAAGHIGLPQIAEGLLVGGGLRAAGQGRGASLLLNAGRGLNAAGEAVSGASDYLSNLGRIGGAAEAPVTGGQFGNIPPEVTPRQPITDEAHMLPAPMLNNGTSLQGMVPSVGDRIRAIGRMPTTPPKVKAPVKFKLLGRPDPLSLIGNNG